MLVLKNTILILKSLHFTVVRKKIIIGFLYFVLFHHDNSCKTNKKALNIYMQDVTQNCLFPVNIPYLCIINLDKPILKDAFSIVSLCYFPGFPTALHQNRMFRVLHSIISNKEYGEKYFKMVSSERILSRSLI